MELPDDVLQLVRAYAKPRFTYFREYHRACKRLRLHSFRNLKRCLLTNPERILSHLDRLEYLDAEFVRISSDFQKRYLEYYQSNQIRIKRNELSVALDKLKNARDTVYLMVIYS